MRSIDRSINQLIKHAIKVPQREKKFNWLWKSCWRYSFERTLLRHRRHLLPPPRAHPHHRHHPPRLRPPPHRPRSHHRSLLEERKHATEFPLRPEKETSSVLRHTFKVLLGLLGVAVCYLQKRKDARKIILRQQGRVTSSATKRPNIDGHFSNFSPGQKHHPNPKILKHFFQIFWNNSAIFCIEKTLANERA